MKREIKSAVDSMATDKSPGPDGFPMEVYKCCWNFMKTEIMSIVEELQDNCFLNWRINTTFIVLIPKEIKR